MLKEEEPAGTEPMEWSIACAAQCDVWRKSQLLQLQCSGSRSLTRTTAQQLCVGQLQFAADAAGAPIRHLNSLS
jgi:hypothetical protein